MDTFKRATSHVALQSVAQRLSEPDIKKSINFFVDGELTHEIPEIFRLTLIKEDIILFTDKSLQVYLLVSLANSKGKYLKFRAESRDLQMLQVI